MTDRDDGYSHSRMASKWPAGSFGLLLMTRATLSFQVPLGGFHHRDTNAPTNGPPRTSFPPFSSAPLGRLLTSTARYFFHNRAPKTIERIVPPMIPFSTTGNLKARQKRNTISLRYLLYTQTRVNRKWRRRGRVLRAPQINAVSRSTLSYTLTTVETFYFFHSTSFREDIHI